MVTEEENKQLTILQILVFKITFFNKIQLASMSKYLPYLIKILLNTGKVLALV